MTRCRAAERSVFVAVLVVLSACSGFPKVWFVNRCGVDIEIINFEGRLSDDQLGTDHAWRPIPVGEGIEDDYDRGISFFVWVRPVGSSAIPEPQAYLFDDLPDRSGSDEDKQLVLEGAACNLS